MRKNKSVDSALSPEWARHWKPGVPDNQKPHIKFSRYSQEWVCMCWTGHVMGVGNTPKDAYTAWFNGGNV